MMTDLDALFILSIAVAGLATLGFVADRTRARRWLDRGVRRVRGW